MCRDEYRGIVQKGGEYVAKNIEELFKIVHFLTKTPSFCHFRRNHLATLTGLRKQVVKQIVSV